MQCSSCRLDSANLREYSRVVDLGDYRKTIETVHLCPACRVLNALNPKYVAAWPTAEAMSKGRRGFVPVTRPLPVAERERAA
ncbi:MAG TPA: hypothetical protein VFB32_11345 [Rudaea sp.]|nr:hypothetical protein [Rudaea sp.]